MPTNETNIAAHPFEKAGLGKAPFRLVGCEERSVPAGLNGETRAGSSCDYCSTAIRDCYLIESADGKRFKVGCDCVRKLGRADNRLVTAVANAKKAANAKKNAAKKAIEATRINAAFARLTDDTLRATLAAKPHPQFADATLLAWVEWMGANAGHAGRLAVAKVIERNDV